jgi:hypothetical protein
MAYDECGNSVQMLWLFATRLACWPARKKTKKTEKNNEKLRKTAQNYEKLRKSTKS